jgi:small subunit ribosomal protein S9
MALGRARAVLHARTAGPVRAAQGYGGAVMAARRAMSGDAGQVLREERLSDVLGYAHVPESKNPVDEWLMALRAATERRARTPLTAAQLLNMNKESIAGSEEHYLLRQRPESGKMDTFWKPFPSEVYDIDAIAEAHELAEAEIRKRENKGNKIVRAIARDHLGRSYGTGRRKTAVARVWVYPGTGRMTVNGKPHFVYFPEFLQRYFLWKPFDAVQQYFKFDVWCTVKGGGHMGQAGAVRLGIARALQNYDPAFRPALKKHGLLKRDPRMPEPKKMGRHSARRGFQWVKR